MNGWIAGYIAAVSVALFVNAAGGLIWLVLIGAAHVGVSMGKKHSKK